MTTTTGWQPRATMPSNGAFIVANKLGQVCFAECRDAHLIVHNAPAYCDWTWGEGATHWMHLPEPPQ